ncbi:hypothetical protein DH2020_043081 [Rehmannia glutinosa]|uniref:Protein kinase domain-containing protein n=1 Tax=Rehmannia glutinosa TaxID=99300 RepID=A0ABR0ULN0_REHGL
MGCVSAKQAVSVTPAALDHSGALNAGSGRSRVGSYGGGGLVAEMELNLKKVKKRGATESGSEVGESGRTSSNGCGSEPVSFRLGNLSKYVEGEQVAAGWPAWLSAVAGEAIQGWIGQGTYSTVFRARDFETGRIVALKKVRFDNFEPESVRFMAREIMINRRLDHPNIIKLEGLITIAILGVMHRDIKGANLLVDNEGVLKVADFGLANFCSFGQRQPLTSRVVTLWYRPPELLLGSTDYGASVDLWSVGCLFAELLTGKPILQGRTELHKIFKLCGSPPEDYWKKSKLPHATLFKPQHPYKSSLWQTFADLPEVAVTLIENLLSVEPFKRGTATSALTSETKPYACDPSSLPKYPPSKEIDIKHHEEASRKRPGARSRGPEARKPTRKQNGMNKLAPEENLALRMQGEPKMNGIGVNNHRGDKVLAPEPPKPSFGVTKEASHVKNASQGDDIYSGPLQVPGSSGFAWAKRRMIDSSLRSRREEENCDVNGQFADTKDHESFETIKRSMLKQWSQLERPDSFDASDGYHSQELSVALYRKEKRLLRETTWFIMIKGRRLNFQVPCYLNLNESMNSWRNTSVISARQFGDHGSREVGKEKWEVTEELEACDVRAID